MLTISKSKIQKMNSEYNNLSLQIENLLRKSIPISEIDSNLEIILNSFFQIIFLVDEVKRSDLIENLTKVILKIKKNYLLNLVMGYYRYIKEVKKIINSDLDKEIEFYHDEDIQLEFILNKNFSQNKELPSIRIYNETFNKKDYLARVIEQNLLYKPENDKFFKYYFLNICENNYKICDNECICKCTLKLSPKNTSLVFKQEKSKDQFYLNRSILNTLENNIRNQIKITKRHTSNFKNSFILITQILNDYFLQNEDEEKLIEKILPFGSVCQFSYNISSDLEITVLTNKNTKLSDEKILDKIHSILSKVEGEIYNNVDKKFTKRTKMISLYDNINKVKIELMLDNFFGVINSSLLRDYCLYDSRVIILINLIKDWSKYNEVNGNYNGNLSSYCFSLMVIYYLQRINPPVLPVLQTSKIDEFQDLIIKDFEKNCYNHYFINSQTQVYEQENGWKPEKQNNYSVAELLFYFFIFYLNYFDEKEYIIDISTEEIMYRYNDIDYLNYGLNYKSLVTYCFVDPIDYSYNPGAYFIRNSEAHRKLINEMQNALKKIMNKKFII